MWLVRSIEQKLRWLASIVEYGGDAIVSTKLDGIITSWNNSAERMFGYLPEEAIGKSITSCLRPPNKIEAATREALGHVHLAQLGLPL